MIYELLDNLNSYAKTQPIIGGVLTLALTGGVGFLLYRLPIRAFNNIKESLSLRYIINQYDSPITLVRIEKYLYKFNGFKISRSFSLHDGVSRGVGNSAVNGGHVLGLGRHVFFIKGLLLVIIKSQKSNGPGSLVNILTIKYVGFNRSKFLLIMEEMIRKSEEKHLLTLEGSHVYGLSMVSKIPKKPLENVILNKEVKEKLLSKVNFFLNNKEWYIKRSLNYKLTILLYGPPGTGKTSLIKSLAHELNYNIAYLDLPSSNKKDLSTFFNKLPLETVVGLEDIDGLSTLTNRDDIKTNPALNKQEEIKLSTILNTLDGVRELENIITIISTNRKEDLDPALFRPGRIDLELFIDYFGKEEVISYIEHWYGCEINKDFIKDDLYVQPALLQQICTENDTDMNNAIIKVNNLTHK